MFSTLFGIFQEIEFFTTSLNQLKMAQTKYLESQESLNKVCPESKDKEILVPLTSSVSFLMGGATLDNNKHYNSQSMHLKNFDLNRFCLYLNIRRIVMY
jgi:hypothetical protein